MAYQIHKRLTDTEELQLFDEKGELKETITVRLDRDGIAQKLSDKQIELVRVQKEAQQMYADMKAGNTGEMEQAYEKIGQVIIEMFEAVFGKEDSDRIRGFYGQNTIQMCTEVLPFITEVVIPKVRELAALKRKQRLQGFKKKKFY